MQDDVISPKVMWFWGGGVAHIILHPLSSFPVICYSSDSQVNTESCFSLLNSALTWRWEGFCVCSCVFARDREREREENKRKKERRREKLVLSSWASVQGTSMWKKKEACVVVDEVKVRLEKNNDRLQIEEDIRYYKKCGGFNHPIWVRFRLLSREGRS